MDEIQILFNIDSPLQKPQEIIVSINSNVNSKLLYKYFIGHDGIWKTLYDFTYENKVKWIPKEDGKYTIMVQAKKEDSKKCFDYVTRKDFIIGKTEEKLIDKIEIDKNVAMVGDKVLITVNSNKTSLMYRYWIKEDSCWNVIKEYSTENTLNWNLKSPGEIEILVECKNIYSNNSYDDFQRVKVNILPLSKIEICDFKCLSEKLLAGNELVFEVDTKSEDSRTVLYKFTKIKEDGEMVCIQDYSTKKIVNYIEDEFGEYKLLCEVKDMYSHKEYDDRALINFKVKKYEEVNIENFTTDKMSPQIIETAICLKAMVSGGKNLLYRYIINGTKGEDSGYTREDNYLWKPKDHGKYKIILWTKDQSCKENYEDKKELSFVIDEKSREPVMIDKIILDKNDKILIDDTLLITVKALGSSALRYSFIIRRDGIEVEKINYGRCNWTKFITEKEGMYEIEARVKDKFSERNFDSHAIEYIKCYKYFPAKIDYLLYSLKDYFLCGDKIHVQAVVTNTTKKVLKYVLKIDGEEAEESEFKNTSKFVFSPKRKGKYTLSVYAKNENSTKKFDDMKSINIKVKDAFPLTDTKIKCNKKIVLHNEGINFSVETNGGKDNIYEFYIMKNNNWTKVQNYSKKNYYSFIPFVKGKYKILALCKSGYKRDAYEDYDIYEFKVE